MIDPDLLRTRIDDMRNEIVDHLVRLVQVPSVTSGFGVGEEPETETIAARLALEPLSGVKAVGRVGRENAVAVVGDGGAVALLHCGHVDVVPSREELGWTYPPFVGHYDGHNVWGRGTADQKSGLVAQVAASLALHREGYRPRRAYAIGAVVGEELGHHALGIDAVMSETSPQHVIISEPTRTNGELRVATWSPGMIVLRITVDGKATHDSLRGEELTAAVPGRTFGVNAIERALPLVAALRDLERSWMDRANVHGLPSCRFTIAPSTIAGGVGGSPIPFVTPDLCTLTYVAWHQPDIEPQVAKDEITKTITTASHRDDWLVDHPPRIEWVDEWPSFTQAADHPLVDALTSCGHATSVFPAVCDASHTARQVPTVVFGPGQLLHAHAVDEHVEVQDVLDASFAFATATQVICGHQQ